jgi:hypothetical protein
MQRKDFPHILKPGRKYFNLLERDSNRIGGASERITGSPASVENRRLTKRSGRRRVGVDRGRKGARFWSIIL